MVEFNDLSCMHSLSSSATQNLFSWKFGLNFFNWYYKNNKTNKQEKIWSLMGSQ